MSEPVDTQEIRAIADRAAVFGTRTDEANALRVCADEIDRLAALCDKWIHAEAAAVSAHLAMGAELVDARQQIERLTAELKLAQWRAGPRGETV